MKRKPIDLHQVERIAEAYARKRMKAMMLSLDEPVQNVVVLIESEIGTAYRAGYIHGRTT